MMGFQKKYLRGLAHGLKPVVLIGQRGCTQTVRRAVDNALSTHELIKVRFIELKDKQAKNEIIDTLINITQSDHIGMIGHTAILYRPHPDPAKRKIELP